MKEKIKYTSFMIVVIGYSLLISACQKEQSNNQLQTNAPKVDSISESTIAASNSLNVTDHQIEITSWDWRIQKGFVEVNGEVVNVSGKALPPLMITVEVKAEDGRVVSTLSGKTGSLQANHSEAFHLKGELKAAMVPGTRRVLMATDTLRFKTKSGTVIEHVDKSKDSQVKSK